MNHMITEFDEEDQGDEDEDERDDDDESDGSDIEIIDDGEIKPLASAKQKGKAPAVASRVAQKKPNLQAIDEEGSSSDEDGESTCRTRPSFGY
jgi:hypothetical protein